MDLLSSSTMTSLKPWLPLSLGTENKIEIRGDPGTYLDQMIVLGFIADEFLLFRGLAMTKLS